MTGYSAEARGSTITIDGTISVGNFTATAPVVPADRRGIDITFTSLNSLTLSEYFVQVTAVSTLGNRSSTLYYEANTGEARVIGQAGADGDSISIGPITQVDDATQFDVINTNGTTTTLAIPNGTDGAFSRTIYRRFVTVPATTPLTAPPRPTGGTLATRPNVAPTDWAFEPPVGSIQLWKAVVTFVPGGDKDEETDIVFGGTSGARLGDRAIAEVGFFDVTGSPGTDIIGSAEISTVTSGGTSGAITGDDPVAEVGFFDVTGSPGTDILDAF